MDDNLKLHATIIQRSLKILRPRVPRAKQELIDTILEKEKAILDFAPILDFKGHPANGVRSAVKYFSNWLEYASSDDRSQDDIEKLIPVLHFMSYWCGVFEEAREFYDKDGRFIMNEQMRQKARKLMSRELNDFDEKAFAVIHSEGYFMRCFPSLSLGLRSFYPLLLFYLRDGLQDFIACLMKFSFSNVVTELSKQWHKMGDMDYGVGAIKLLNSLPWRTYLPIYQFLMSIGKPRVQVNEHIVEFQRKYDIEVDIEGVHLRILPQPQYRKVTFSILKDESSMDHHAKVLMYIHGGGFVGPHYSFNDNLFTKDLCNAIPGLTVLSVKYSFAPEKPFPRGLMDTLDAYLWLTSGDAQVEEILGFKPQDIMISGDSSGGNFAVSLTVLINEIRLLDKNFKPVFPSSLILIYPVVALDETLYSSAMLSSIDLILSSYVLNNIARAYIPMKIRDKNGNYRIVKSSDIPADWSAKEEYEIIRSPFISPVYYEKLEDLSHIPISVLALEFDPIMDGSVHIAREWKGPVDFYFVPEAYHGCLILHHVSSAAKKIFDCYVEMTKKALSRPINT